MKAWIVFLLLVPLAAAQVPGGGQVTPTPAPPEEWWVSFDVDDSEDVNFANRNAPEGTGKGIATGTLSLPNGWSDLDEVRIYLDGDLIATHASPGSNVGTCPTTTPGSPSFWCHSDDGSTYTFTTRIDYYGLEPQSGPHQTIPYTYHAAFTTSGGEYDSNPDVVVISNAPAVEAGSVLVLEDCTNNPGLWNEWLGSPGDIGATGLLWLSVTNRGTQDSGFAVSWQEVAFQQHPDNGAGASDVVPIESMRYDMRTGGWEGCPSEDTQPSLAGGQGVQSIPSFSSLILTYSVDIPESTSPGQYTAPYTITPLPEGST